MPRKPEDDSARLAPVDFGRAFKAFLDDVVGAVPAEEPAFFRRLREHFRSEPSGLPVIAHEFGTYDHPNLQLALDAVLSSGGRAFEAVGVGGQAMFAGFGLAELATPPGRGMGGFAPVEGPIAYRNVQLDGGRILACTQSGVFFVREGRKPLALLIRGPDERHGMSSVRLEVMAKQSQDAQKFLSLLRERMGALNVYRGKVVSLSSDHYGQMSVRFHTIPRVRRGDIVLPAGVLERVERHTIGFARHTETLRAAKRHLKRGLLLHGQPGTGKTLTIMYTVGQMPGRTVLLLTGQTFQLIEPSFAMARDLQPATIVLEDVDLIAMERTHIGSPMTLLFEFLNQLDGLAEDADIVFLMTSNRPDLLEPALAARPGRVDQAIHFPLPDAAARRRLLELYMRGVRSDVRGWDRLVERTEGVAAAFIRELVRKALLFAADESDEPRVGDAHFESALYELVVEGGDLTKTLLGGRPAVPPAP